MKKTLLNQLSSMQLAFIEGRCVDSDSLLNLNLYTTAWKHFHTSVGDFLCHCWSVEVANGK
jgi:hypothetical protein